MNENHIIKVSIEKKVYCSIENIVLRKMLLLTWPSGLKKSQNFEDEMIVYLKIRSS